MTMNVLFVVSGSRKKIDGYHRRVLSIAEILKNKKKQIQNVHVIWFYPAFEIFQFSKRGLECEELAIHFIPALSFYSHKLIVPINRWVTKCIVRFFCRVAGIHIMQSEMQLFSYCMKKGDAWRFVVDYHGDLVSEMKANNHTAWQISLAQSDEKRAFEHAQGSIFVSRNLQSVMESRFCKPLRSVLAPSCVDTEQFIKPYALREKRREELGVSGKIVLAYCGGLQPWQCIDWVVDIFKKLYSGDTRYYLMLFTNHSKETVQETLDAFCTKGENYNFMSLPMDEVPFHLLVGDIGMLLRRNDPVNLVASPTKCSEYLAAGMPVISTPFAGDSPALIQRENVGFVIAESNDESMGGINESIRIIMENRKDYFNRCQSVARRYLSWNHSVENILELYRS
ncbi:MAG: hypothetical protein JW795_19380 [Chitinivibrionales bacterium]|nr:hypothetical protein [Chitinivibrionales bacterium]